MEIERKYLVETPPENYQDYPSSHIEQAYLCTSPVVRIRREDDRYSLTYKGKGLLAREEYNLPLTEEAYRHLLPKADGIVLAKRRYRIPLPAVAASENPESSTVLSPGCGLTIELDIFEGEYDGLMLAEVEFPSIEEAGQFIPPGWFGKDVTFSGEYQNSKLSIGR